MRPGSRAPQGADQPGRGRHALRAARQRQRVQPERGGLYAHHGHAARSRSWAAATRKRTNPEMHHGCSVLKSAGHLQDWDWVYYVPNGNRAGPDTTTLPGEFGAALCGSRYKCAPAAASAPPGVGSVAALACDGGALKERRQPHLPSEWHLGGAWNDCTCPWRLLARGSAGNVRLPAGGSATIRNLMEVRPRTFRSSARWKTTARPTASL